MTAPVRESEKALRYINQLDSARCQGLWDQVPELTRKVEKHAPHRKILVLAARSEATVASVEASSPLETSALPSLIAPLLDAIGSDQPYENDKFQATVCLGWVHWVLRESQLAAARLPNDPAEALEDASGEVGLSSQWVQVCASKCAYIKGFSLEKTGVPQDALIAYGSMLPALSSLPGPFLSSMSSQFRAWTERLLTRFIAASMKTAPLSESTDFDKLLQVFHLWTSLFKFSPTDQKTSVQESSQTGSPMPYLSSDVEYSRWDMWMAYYATLSEILKHGLVYSPTYTDSHPQVLRSLDILTGQEFQASRLKQRTELKNVESRIESKLLAEASFPRANGRNGRVERWVDAVMRNWGVMCGRTWQDEDLGEGGKNAIARGVLDILYRAATKTFHSTQVLRHLFHVHAYLAEFELAIKALDSYHKIVIHGKARSEKSGEIDYSLDGNDRILSISSEAIIILCRFGQRKEAEKAREIASKVAAWVEEFDVQPAIPESAGTNGVTTLPPQQFAAPSTMALAHHALGTSEAHWARLSLEATSRTGHQTKALDHFRVSVHRRFGQSKNLDFLFSLAVVMAEMRDIQGAIKVVKQALAEGAQQLDTSDPDSHIPERKLIRFWHLLTLLLSTRSDLVSAAKASNAVFEQFKEPSVVFGHQEFRSEHLNETNPTPESKGLVDRMGTFEKEGILQVRITQVALLEALEGPTAAVDASADLLALYARLFGGMKDRDVSKTLSTTVKVPKTAVGSLRASIFKRARSRKGERDEPTSRATTARPSTVATTVAAPTIQVTDESSSGTPRGRRVNGSHGQNLPIRTRSRGGDSNTVTRSSSQHKLHKRNSARNSMESFQVPSPVVPYDEAPQENGVPSETDPRVSVQSSRRPSLTPSATTGASFVTAELDPAAEPSPPQLLSPHRSRPSIRSTNSYRPTVAVGLESNPAPTFPSLADKRHKTTLLVELWLFVSGLYTRSALYDDAQAAIDEAVELVKQLEMYVSRQSSSAKAFSTRGWGGGRSIDELWGDVWTQRGELAHSNSLPHEALSHFEIALSYCPNHAIGMVGLSNLLLDIYDETIPPEPLEYLSSPEFFSASSSRVSQLVLAARSDLPHTPATATTASLPPLSRSQTATSHRPTTSNSSLLPSAKPQPTTSSNDNSDEPPVTSSPEDPAPDLLDRLAARDRAYHLLSTLTKLGTGWDYSEAWFSLARAYELSGQVEKAKEVLLWCVELEDSRPLRGWRVVGMRGFDI